MPPDAIDRRIIERLQSGIAVTRRPFEAVSIELEVDEAVVIGRLAKLLDDGVLSRFGPMFNADVLGGAYCLCAMSVPEERFEQVCEQVNAFVEVAHNYERDHRLNMWFVIATDNPANVSKTIHAIERQTGLKVLDFPKEEEYFVELLLPLEESPNEHRGVSQ